jgi:hypothetical protein
MQQHKDKSTQYTKLTYWIFSSSDYINCTVTHVDLPSSVPICVKNTTLLLFLCIYVYITLPFPTIPYALSINLKLHFLKLTWIHKYMRILRVCHVTFFNIFIEQTLLYMHMHGIYRFQFFHLLLLQSDLVYADQRKNQSLVSCAIWIWKGE